MKMSNQRMEPQEPNRIAVTAPGPYPPIKVSEKNINIVNMLQTDLAAAKSELTSVTQYFYEGWIWKANYPVIAETTLRIAEVEMHHLNIIGELITLLGGNPRFQSAFQGRRVPWNASCLVYSMNVKQLLQRNIFLEKGAVDIYTRQSKVIRDKCISEILARLALDEQLHVQIYTDFLKELE